MPLWELFARYQRSEKALVLALQEAYLQGVSTRKVKKLTEQLCGTAVSKSFVSQVCQALDADIDAWRTRPLDQAYPYLMVDACYEHIRNNRRVVSQAVLVVQGVNQDGYRDRLPQRNTCKAREVQILRETIIPEVALLERRAALTDERIAEHGDLTDADENPRQQVVPLKYLPGDTETLARFLQTRPKRPHAPTLPGRFSWTIQRPL